jgi:hypothetical protein
VVALITAMILDRPMCIHCIAAKLVITEARTEEALAVIKSVLVLRRETGRCQACGETNITAVSARRPAG